MSSVKGMKPLLIVVVMMLSMSAWAAEQEAVTPLEAALVEQSADRDKTLEAFYAERDWRPVWQDPSTVTAFAEALHTLEGDGLSPSDYRPDALSEAHRRAWGDGEGDPQELADFELRTSHVLLTALRHLQKGKVDPQALDTGWEVPVEPPALDVASLSRHVDARRFEQAFADVRPSYPPYQRLRAGLARYQDIDQQGGWPTLPPLDGLLRPGDVHDAVPFLRERLAVIGEPGLAAADTTILPDAKLVAPDPFTYDEALTEAVERFQERHLLEVDGVVGPDTLAALNVPVGERIDQIRINLERTRWLLHGLPETFVLVDIAGYRVSYYRPNGDIWRSRIVVGQPYRRTPSLRSEITHLTVNPTWTIPPTIRREDVIPKIHRDLGYLERNNIRVLSYSGSELDPRSIDWQDPGKIMLRQEAGPENPLGRVVIRFPNDHMVYLHDTPAQQLFSRQQRAISSGCIRVENVMTLVQLLLDDTDTYRDIRALVAEGETRNVPLESHVPVILHYWTAHVGEEGELSFRPDIYDRDDELLEALDRPLVL
ncbi:L,D-transpeptidase family protein [Halomonas daqiaonensis]|uniref:Murein L,D-transpeptidase YcbB/YkuD n=1 Tax=Halomonas daqiaonensis TaxID=650850 RepID=A0A1H7V724_9GAMM|nr:L,D-transpeptidase family protein [Halomonas daqiaonensis]SEM04840.1 Murein L,D-transpeptidase YcbB/YkuD [Halomonas daqiaonensis]